MSFESGTPFSSQQVINLNGERFHVAGEDILGELGASYRSWVISSTPVQDGDASKEFAIPITDFSGGAGYSFASVPNVYEYADGWDCTAPKRPGTWARRATMQALPATVDYPGWILPVSTYVYAMRGRYCAKYIIDDTQDAVWPVVEVHDFGSGVVVAGRPVVFKGVAYIPLRTGAGGALTLWQQLSPTLTIVEQQTIAISGTPTGGTYTLSWNGSTTTAIAYNATAADIQAALRLLPGLQYVTVALTSGSAPNFTYTVTMTGAGAALSSASPAQMTRTDSTTGGAHAVTIATTIAGTVDTWTAGPAGKEASCFIVNGINLWRANANTLSSVAANPLTGADWGGPTEVGESGREITELGVYEGDIVVLKTDGLYRFTEDLQATQELDDVKSVVDTFNGRGTEYSNGYMVVPHKNGLIRWRPGAYAFVGPEQEGALEGDKSLGWGRVASLAPYGKQLFYAANDPYDGVGIIGSLLPAIGEVRGADYGVTPHTHVVAGSASSPTSIEAVRAVTSTTQGVGPQTPATWSDNNAVGSLAWTNPSNAGLSDGSKATAAGTGTTHYLKGVAPPVNIPTGATMQGILVEIERSGYATYAPNDSQSGYVACSSGTYATARSGGGTLSAVSSSVALFCGQYFASGSYFFYEMLLAYDTSAIPDSATILSATLSLGGNAGLGTQGSGNLQARLDDFGSGITTGDFVAGASLSAKALLATVPIASFGSSGVVGVTFASETAFISNINKTGETRLLLCTEEMVSGTTPTNTAPLVIYPNGAGSGVPNVLTVVYRDVLDNIVKLVIAGSVTGTNMADAVNTWPDSDAIASYGGATSTWGGLPTVDQANGIGGDFGVVISAISTGAANFAIDHVQMTVYYTVAGVADTQSFLIAMEVTSGKTIASGLVYKLPRADLTPVNDPNVNHAQSDAILYSSRYPHPSRNNQKTYRDLELWLDATPETNTPGLEVWARVDEAPAFQLLDSSGTAATLRTTGAHTLYFPSTSAAVGHYVQFEWRIPALVGSEAPVAVSFRDCTLRGVVDADQADSIQMTLVLGGGEFADGMPSRLTNQRQRELLRELARPLSAPVSYQDIAGNEGFLKVVSYEITERKFKKYDQPLSVARIIARELNYGG